MANDTAQTGIAIVGGGAAGLMAALAAAEAGGRHIVILERHPRVGKKILATGNGRCNLSNINAAPAYYHGESPEFCRAALSAFSPRQTMTRFEKMGVCGKVEEEGKVYPYSDQASSVLDCLRMAAAETGVIRECCAFDVQTIRPEKGGFLILEQEQSMAAKRVIVATGGKAAPNLCSDGSGYALLKRLGHTITPLHPALVQIRTDNRVSRSLKGIKFLGSASLKADGQTVQREDGEILFTEYGVSGPPIFALSRCAAEYETSGKVNRNPVQKLEISLNLFPGREWEEVYATLAERLKNCGGRTLEQFFVGMLHKRIGQEIFKALELLPLSRLCSTLTDRNIREIVSTLCDWRFAVKGGHSFRNAQVTAGGVRTAEVNSETMESRRVPGLYLAGEILDIDGDCGGFNLQWAWSSGMLAGRSAARSLAEGE